MRYRRRHYRYAVVAAAERPRSAIDWWQVTGTIVVTPGAWRPRTDVYETAERVLVTVELPGVEPDDLDVQLFEDALLVEGRRPVPETASNGLYHSAEIPRGRFRLSLVLPAVIDPDRGDARFDRGLLELALPKAGEASDGH